MDDNTPIDADAPAGPNGVPAIQIHPLAERFPSIEGRDFEDLVEDIKKHGLRQPIVKYQDAVLDGRSRYRACMQAGVSPVFISYAGDDPESFVDSLNIHRRHLTADQKRALVEKSLKADPEQSNRAIAATAHVDGKTVAAIRKNMEAREEIPHVAKRKDTKGRKQAAKRTAAKPAPAKTAKPAMPKQPVATDLKLMGCAPDAWAERLLAQWRVVTDEHRVAFADKVGLVPASKERTLAARFNAATREEQEAFAAEIGLLNLVTEEDARLLFKLDDAETLVRLFKLATRDQQAAFVNDSSVGLRALVTLASFDQLDAVQSIFSNRTSDEGGN